MNARAHVDSLVEQCGRQRHREIAGDEQGKGPERRRLGGFVLPNHDCDTEYRSKYQHEQALMSSECHGERAAEEKLVLQ